MRICAIGCGRHSTELHGPSLKSCAEEQPDVSLDACCDRDEHRAASYREKFGFSRCYTDMEQMLDREDPDAVVLVLPPELTCSIAQKLLPRHIPLLMEKPPGLASAELAELIASASREGTPVQVGFNRRFMPLISLTHDFLDHHLKPEAVFQINYDMIRFNRLEPDFSVTAIHAIDAALFLARSPYQEARFFYQDLPATGKPALATAMEATCRSGTRVRCNFQPAAGTVLERIAIHGLQMTFTVDLPIWESFDSPGTLRVWQQNHLLREIRGTREEDHKSWGFQAQLESFLNCLRTGRKPFPGLEEVRQSVALMEAMREGREKVDFSRKMNPFQETHTCPSKLC